MKRGDLVTLRDYCKNSGRMAIISEVPDSLNCVKIMYLDTLETASALTKNIIPVEEKDDD